MYSSHVGIFLERDILVDSGDREAKAEAMEFDGIACSQRIERPEALFLAAEDFDEGKLRTEQQVFLLDIHRHVRGRAR
jgi:hypothetical protein